jgi:hypothetical protein
MSCQISSRWTPGYHCQRDASGAFEAVNCPRFPETHLAIQEQLYAEEVSAWVIGCALVVLAMAIAIMLDAPQLVLSIIVPFGVLAMAMLVGLIPWAIWGGPKHGK